MAEECGANVWEKRMDGESARAFQAFCMYRAMGYRRSIRECLELHGIEQKRYGSWARWSRLYDWEERAKCALFLHDTVLNEITGLKDADGRPLWRQPWEKMPGVIDGYAAHTCHVLP